MSEEALGLRLNYPATAGILLAVNAVPDAFVVEDGPGCHFYRAMAVQGRHDWASTLLSCEGHHRVQSSGVNLASIATSYEGMLRESVERLADQESAAVVLLSSLSMCGVAGTDYERVLKESRCAKPVFRIPDPTLSGDWLDGYARTLEALAGGMDLAGACSREDAVAVVGYFMDRREGDHAGNVAELRRMLSALGLDCVTVWLSGERYEDLRRVRQAGTVIGLPHGRKAAAALARRLGVRLIETGLPFGLEGSSAWLRRVAGALGREERAEAFLSSELRRLAPALEWVIPRVFLNRRFVFAGDPHLLEGWMGLEAEVGMRLTGAFFNAGPQHDAGAGRDEVETACEPSVESLRRSWKKLQGEGAELLVASSDVLTYLRPDCARLEFGFPSVDWHCLRDVPYLGLRGCAHLLERLASALTRRDAEQS